MLICSARLVHRICNGVGYIEQVLVATYKPVASLTPGEHAVETVRSYFLQKSSILRAWWILHRRAFYHYRICRTLFTICVTECYMISFHTLVLILAPPSLSSDNFRTCILSCTLYRTTGPGWLSRYSDSLRPERSGDRKPVGARFSAPVQTVPGAYPASCTMGTGSFQRVKRPGRGVDHPPHLRADVMKG